MKKILKFSAEFVEEFDETEDPEYKDLSFNDWCDIDWDCVGRQISRLEDEGWKITKSLLNKI